METSFVSKKVFEFERQGKRVIKVISSYKLCALKEEFNYDCIYNVDAEGFFKQWNFAVKKCSGYDNLIVSITSEAVCNPEDEYKKEVGIKMASLRNDIKLSNALDAWFKKLRSLNDEYLNNIQKKLFKKSFALQSTLDSYIREEIGEEKKEKVTIPIDPDKELEEVIKDVKYFLKGFNFNL